LIVVDASAILEVLLRTEAAKAVELAIFDPKESLHAPHLLDLEIAQVLRRYAAAGDIDYKRGQEALTDLKDMPIFRYPHGLLLPRVWDLRNNTTAYDAAYIALAEGLDARLVTRDVRLDNSPGHTARIEVI
jgi:predicted nucleic acid-binding protein